MLSKHHAGDNYTPYQNDVVTPIQAGSTPQKLVSGTLHDNDNGGGKKIITDMFGGSSFDKLCSTFSEFTATYWLWKNTTSDYVGLFHYRRSLNLGFELPPSAGREEDSANFPKKYCEAHGLTRKNIAFLMNPKVFKTLAGRICYDALVVDPYDCTEGNQVFPGQTIIDQFRSCHNCGSNNITDKFFGEARNVVQNKFPDMAAVFDSHYNTRGEPAYFKCQIVATRGVFNDYVNFIMTVLEGIYIKYNALVEAINTGDSRGNRLYAYMGERLSSLFIAYSISAGKIKVKKVPLCYYGSVSDYNNYYSRLNTHYKEKFVYGYKDKKSEGLLNFFAHRKVNNLGDKRVSLKINYVGHDNRDWSAVIKDNVFHFYRRGSRSPDGSHGLKLDFQTDDGQRLFAEIVNGEFFVSGGNNNVGIVSEFTYKTWNDIGGYYIAEPVCWSEQKVINMEPGREESAFFILSRAEKLQKKLISKYIQAIGPSGNLFYFSFFKGCFSTWSFSDTISGAGGRIIISLDPLIENSLTVKTTGENRFLTISSRNDNEIIITEEPTGGIEREAFIPIKDWNNNDINVYQANWHDFSANDL